jgi:3-hydroxybutyryl-CoA dehydrogenase
MSGAEQSVAPSAGAGDEGRPWPRRAAVIGSGTMGGGFAQLLSLAGVEVAVADVSAQRAEQARAETIAGVTRFVADGLMAEGAVEAVSDRVRAARHVADAVTDAELVLEAVTEDPSVKQAVFAAVEAAAPADCVIASNTSAIPIGDLAAPLQRPERFLGAHWFNPPQWVPCVEVIPTPATAPEVVQRVHELLRRLGKEPVTVGDAAGFVANRIQFAMFKEAASCVADGVATADQVDAVVRSSFGFRLPFYGPFAIADMAGLDVYAGAYAALTADHGERFSVPESVAEHVAAGRLGAKTGGAYLAPDPERAAQRDRAYHALGALLGELADPAGDDARE